MFEVLLEPCFRGTDGQASQLFEHGVQSVYKRLFHKGNNKLGIRLEELKLLRSLKTKNIPPKEPLAEKLHLIF
jgi:hypothetical protein